VLTVQGGWRVLIKNQKLYAAPLGNYDTPTMQAALRGENNNIDYFLLLIQKLLCVRRVPDVEFVYR